MSFTLPQYHEPDFQETRFQSAPEARFEPAPKDGVAPEGYHATTIYPEYFKVGGRWLLAEESRMDCVAALRDGKIAAVEFRNLKAGEPVAVGRTEGLRGHLCLSLRLCRGEGGGGDLCIPPGPLPGDRVLHGLRLHL